MPASIPTTSSPACASPTPVWVALLAARGFSLWEIGVAESVFHMVSLTFEVPSGMAADLLGRKKTLVAGGVCMVLSNLPMAFAPDLFFICLAMALSALANAMFSGTASALTYDSLKQCGRTDDYLRVSANCSRLSHAGHGCGVPRQHAGTVSPLFRFLPAERRL
ncbi:MAG: MFS transporter [Faecalibacterium prausnitzii]